MRVLIDSILMFIGVCVLIALILGLYELLMLIDFESVVTYAVLVYVGSLTFALLKYEMEKR